MKAYSASRRGAQVDRRAGPVAQLQVAGDEIGVKVRQDDMPNLEAVCAGKGEVLVDVALGIDDDRGVRRLVADEIRGVRQTSEVELLQDHALSPLPSESWNLRFADFRFKIATFGARHLKSEILNLKSEILNSRFARTSYGRMRWRSLASALNSASHPRFTATQRSPPHGGQPCISSPGPPASTKTRFFLAGVVLADCEAR